MAGLIFELHPPNFQKMCIFWRCTNGISTIFCYLLWFQFCKKCQSLPVHPTVVSALLYSFFSLFSDLRFNKIRHIPRGTFQNLTQMNTLLLNNNKLRRLRNGAFSGLENLQYLYLYKNQIHLIETNVFKDVPNLEHLYLHFNQIKVISPQLFQGMSHLHRL